MMMMMADGWPIVRPTLRRQSKRQAASFGSGVVL